jgi:hypothetical protein
MHAQHLDMQRWLRCTAGPLSSALRRVRAPFSLRPWLQKYVGTKIAGYVTQEQAFSRVRASQQLTM